VGTFGRILVARATVVPVTVGRVTYLSQVAAQHVLVCSQLADSELRASLRNADAVKEAYEFSSAG
jgi:hypothetical protein